MSIKSSALKFKAKIKKNTILFWIYYFHKHLDMTTKYEKKKPRDLLSLLEQQIIVGDVVVVTRPGRHCVVVCGDRPTISHSVGRKVK